MTKIISLEGGEGAGKTSVIEALKQHFEAMNKSVLFTREPGGVPISERIRAIILDAQAQEMDHRTEALLFAAARRQHLVEKVLPAIKSGVDVVVFDRYVDSSMVYQGFVRGIGVDEVYDMNLFATEGFLPDLTLYLDVDPQIGLQRINSNPNREINKLDLEHEEFHEKVREGYLALLERFPERIRKVDANQGIEFVIKDILKEIEVLI
ncbi:dTMP kinase [Fusibacter tunisiensis]|uniref:Thymidylate kinase n=1 Tax=Fusibacter tunisiensis TaxID=1008308 RepID=A0ABS2MRC5_9FIRM|nr:dTMP kinase [Fusibacter tunisiensis]MBM7561948.1 dTMP kinase [Fusibacter tunisiensis]